MKAHHTKRISYEQPRSEVFELTTQGVLCQSVEAQNMENPGAPTSTDNSW